MVMLWLSTFVISKECLSSHYFCHEIVSADKLPPLNCSLHREQVPPCLFTFFLYSWIGIRFSKLLFSIIGIHWHFFPLERVGLQVTVMRSPQLSASTVCVHHIIIIRFCHEEGERSTKIELSWTYENTLRISLASGQKSLPLI